MPFLCAKSEVWSCFRGARSLLAPLLLLGAASLPVGAQTPDEVKQKIEASRQQLEERKRAETGLRSDIGQLAVERDRLNQNMLATAKLIQRGEAQLSTIEARLSELEAQEKLVRGSLAQRHDSIAHLLAAIQRMGRNPPPVLITKREDALRMVRSAMLLASAFPELRGQAVALADRLNELARIMGEAKSESDKLKAETARLGEARTRLSELMESKRHSLAERQVELEKVRRETFEISKNVNDLSELIARLDRTMGHRPARDAAATPTEAQATTPPALAEVGRPDGAPSAPATAETPTAKAGERVAAIEIVPKGLQSPKRELGRMEPAVPFIQAKGRLPLPAQGARVLAYGDKTQYGSQSKGIVLETRHGAQVTSPADGWVIFAGEFRTFGQLLIIDGGGGYHILLAGLSQIDVQPRQFVLAGEPVGVMTSAPKSATPKAADGSPVLYIEFRKDNKPIDPDPWWLSEAQKVQG